MLPRDYRFHIVNNSGVTIEFATDAANNTFAITGRGWKFTSGALAYHGSELTLMPTQSASDVADTISLVSDSDISNATNLFIGMHCTAALVTDAATDGTLDIYYEYSTDGASTWPSDAVDFDAEADLIHVASISLGTTTEDRTINFEL